MAIAKIPTIFKNKKGRRYFKLLGRKFYVDNLTVKEILQYYKQLRKKIKKKRKKRNSKISKLSKKRKSRKSEIRYVQGSVSSAGPGFSNQLERAEHDITKAKEANEENKVAANRALHEGNQNRLAFQDSIDNSQVALRNTRELAREGAHLHRRIDALLYQEPGPGYVPPDYGMETPVRPTIPVPTMPAVKLEERPNISSPQRPTLPSTPISPVELDTTTSSGIMEENVSSSSGTTAGQQKEIDKRLTADDVYKLLLEELETYKKTLNREGFAVVKKKALELMQKSGVKERAPSKKSESIAILVNLKKKELIPQYLRQYDVVPNLTAKLRGKGCGDGEGLYDDQIDKIMNKYPEYLGTISRDGIKYLLPRITPQSRIAFIINSDRENGPGKHWFAVYIDARPEGSHTIEFFDSFGRAIPESILADIRLLAQMLKPTTYLKVKENRVVHQSDDSDSCGWMCMKFLIDRFRGKSFAEATGYDDKVKQYAVEKNEAEIEKLKNQAPFKYI